MRTPVLLAAAAALLLLPLAAAAAVEMRFVQPQQYTDAGLRSLEREPSAALQRELTALLQRLGDIYLEPGQDLAVDVLDLDLAGRFQWWDPSRGEIRVMDSVSWPRMRLRYRLSRDGETLSEGEDHVSDMDYLSTASARGADPLRYEKNMLEDWFRARFGGGRQPV